jgi:hypothetical protein
LLPRIPSLVFALALSLGTASHAAAEVSCLHASECNDGDACTGDLCIAGACVHRQKSDCVACAADADCDDGNRCTSESCSAGRCTVAPVPGCSLEICGNCLDDDGNGLVDLADAACCAPERTASMELVTGLIAPGPETSRLRLTATLGASVGLSPDGQQVLLQLGTAPGGAFCAAMPPSAFRGTPRKLRLARGAVAGANGVRRMVLRQRADGSVGWRARGRRVGFSTDEREGSLDVLLLLADATHPGAAPRCFTGRAQFRPGPRGTLVTP